MPESNSCPLCNKEQLVPSILAVDNDIKFTREDVRGDGLSFLDCALHNEDDRSLNIEVYRKPTHRLILAVQLSLPTGAQAGGYQNPKPLG